MIINQEFGTNWVNYNGDCVFVMSGLPDESVDFNIHSPPFLSLYIYSDSIADLGNTDSEKQFFTGYLFALKEMWRVLKPGRHMAIHCKDTMRYMSSSGYAGLYDFPGEIINIAQEAGFTFQRWITIWKDPVVEMQRTKTYGLLHKSFITRAEVTRQGCADYVLIFSKPYENEQFQIVDNNISQPLLENVIKRATHQWSQKDEIVRVNELSPNTQLSFWSKPLSFYNSEFVQELSDFTVPGRLAITHCQDLVSLGTRGTAARYNMSSDIIKQFQGHDSWKFHSRLALTNGTSLVAFRNWTQEFKRNYQELNGIVKHELKAPVSNNLIQFDTDEAGTLTKVKTGIKVVHPDYIGKSPPTSWGDDTYYSILVWQRYASPIWFDLDGLPDSHKDAWMNIDQTNVLNLGLKDEKEQRHICPLQLDLIDHLILEYTESGEVVYSPYGGIGSEGVGAIKRDRRVILSELKPSYWDIANRGLEKIELEKMQRRLPL